jgi:hypothetical protein
MDYRFVIQRKDNIFIKKNQIKLLTFNCL